MFGGFLLGALTFGVCDLVVTIVLKKLSDRKAVPVEDTDDG